MRTSTLLIALALAGCGDTTGGVQDASLEDASSETSQSFDAGRADSEAADAAPWSPPYPNCTVASDGGGSLLWYACPATQTCELKCATCAGANDVCLGYDDGGSLSATCTSNCTGCELHFSSNGSDTQEDLCGDRCTDTQIDDENCGSCGRACAGSSQCGQGHCCPGYPSQWSTHCGACCDYGDQNVSPQCTAEERNDWNCVPEP